jgi:hypothetical protein
MAAAIEDHGLGATDLVGELLRDTGRADGILIAGDDQRGAVDQPMIGFLRLPQRLAGAGKTPPHPGAYGKRNRHGIIVGGGAGQGRTDYTALILSWRADAARVHSLSRAAPRGSRIGPNEVRLATRSGRRDGQVSGDQGAEGIADDMRAVNAEMGGRALEHLDQKSNSDVLRGRRRAAGAWLSSAPSPAPRPLNLLDTGGAFLFPKSWGAA